MFPDLVATTPPLITLGQHLPNQGVVFSPQELTTLKTSLFSTPPPGKTMAEKEEEEHTKMAGMLKQELTSMLIMYG